MDLERSGLDSLPTWGLVGSGAGARANLRSDGVQQLAVGRGGAGARYRGDSGGTARAHGLVLLCNPP